MSSNKTPKKRSFFKTLRRSKAPRAESLELQVQSLKNQLSETQQKLVVAEKELEQARRTLPAHASSASTSLYSPRSAISPRFTTLRPSVASEFRHYSSEVQLADSVIYRVGSSRGFDLASLNQETTRLQRTLSDVNQVGGHTQAVVLSGLLAKVPLFSEFDAFERLSLAQKFQLDRYKLGDYLIRKNEVGDRFFVLLEGQVGVFINTVSMPKLRELRDSAHANQHDLQPQPWQPLSPNTHSPSALPNARTSTSRSSNGLLDGEPAKRPLALRQSSRRYIQLHPGDHFGESVLIRGAAQTASVVAVTAEVQCLTLSRAMFRDMLSRFEATARTNTEAFLKHSKENQSFVEKTRQAAADAMNKQEYFEVLDLLPQYRMNLSSVDNQYPEHQLPGGETTGSVARTKLLDDIDYSQIMKDISRESMVILNGKTFNIAEGGEQEYLSFLEQLTDAVIELVQVVDPSIGESEASQLVVEVLKKCTRTSSGGDAYLQCTLLLSNPDLVIFTPATFDNSGETILCPIKIDINPDACSIVMQTHHAFNVCHIAEANDDSGVEDTQLWATLHSLLEESIELHCVATKPIETPPPTSPLGASIRATPDKKKLPKGHLHNLYQITRRDFCITSVVKQCDNGGGVVM